MYFILDVSLSFLLTPLREGRHTQPSLEIDLSIISTHAPAGGATNRAKIAVDNGHISTHAPAGGATRAARAWSLPRCISTHAPAGGATVPERQARRP